MWRASWVLPSAGHGPHRYIFCVTAVDVEKLDIDENASPRSGNFSLLGTVWVCVSDYVYQNRAAPE